MCMITEVADAVVATLNTGSFSRPFTARRCYLPLLELPELKDLHVSVVPRGVTIANIGREVNQHEVQIDVAVQKRVGEERVRSSHVIWTDDTPVKVLDPALPHCRTGRFWVYCGDGCNPYSIYEYTASRKRDGPVRFLESYRGYLQADAFSGYDGIYADGQVRQVLCWAHARRKFFDAQTSKPEEAQVALAYVGRLYRVEREVKQHTGQFDFGNPADRERWHALRWKRRRESSLPILDQFHAWLEGARHRVLPKSPMGQAIGYVLPRWEGLKRYCEEGELSIDNNLAERTLRACAIGRKNWTFLGNDHGGRVAAILYSFTASCKANQAEPFAYLRDVIQRMAELRNTEGHSQTTLTSLLPDLWLKSNPNAYRPWSR